MLNTRAVPENHHMTMTSPAAKTIMAAIPASAAVRAETEDAELLVGSAVVELELEGAELLLLWVTVTLPEVAADDGLISLLEADGCCEPELAIALALNAAAVWSPLVGGLTASTMPSLQSEPTDEKNLDV